MNTNAIPQIRQRTVVACIVCGEQVERVRRGRCARCYEWFWRHSTVVDGQRVGPERPASVDLLGTQQPCRSCGIVARNHGHKLCQACYQWALSHGKQWDVPKDRPRVGDITAAITKHQAPIPWRGCARCGSHMGRKPPGYQELCRPCSKQWWAEEQAAQDGRATKLYANPTSHPTRLAASPGMVEQQVRTEQGA